MKKFIDAHPYFVALFAMLFGGTVLRSLYELFFKNATILDVAIRLSAGLLATVLVSYIGLKMLGLWRVEKKSEDGEPVDPPLS